jgi:hypothetical protein
VCGQITGVWVRRISGTVRQRGFASSRSQSGDRGGGTGEGCSGVRCNCNGDSTGRRRPARTVELRGVVKARRRKVTARSRPGVMLRELLLNQPLPATYIAMYWPAEEMAALSTHGISPIHRPHNHPAKCPSSARRVPGFSLCPPPPRLCNPSRATCVRARASRPASGVRMSAQQPYVPMANPTYQGNPVCRAVRFPPAAMDALEKLLCHVCIRLRRKASKLPRGPRGQLVRAEH